MAELRSQSRRKPRRARGVGGRSRSKEGMAQQSARRGRKNQGFPPCHEHAVGDVVPVRELPYGPAAQRCIKGRTDGSIRLRVRTSRYRLQPKGRPQMESGTAASERQEEASRRSFTMSSRQLGANGAGRRPCSIGTSCVKFAMLRCFITDGTESILSGLLTRIAISR